jgi:hypothetical protein
MDGPQEHAFLQEILNRDIEWTQGRTGYSIATLTATMALVERWRMPVRYLLMSRKRYELLVGRDQKGSLAKAPGYLYDRFGGPSGALETYRDADFRTWEMVHDDYVYCLGDIYPPNEKSVAVMEWRRPSVSN